jgi:hypothetical protein
MCVPSCVNGICTEDGCKCYDGFYNTSEFECTKNCSDGFVFLFDECIEEGEFELFGDETSVRSTTNEDLFSSNESSYEDNFDVSSSR